MVCQVAVAVVVAVVVLVGVVVAVVVEVVVWRMAGLFVVVAEFVV